MKKNRFTRAGETLIHLLSALAVGLVLVAVGQPIFTDDAWWHLALGRAYLAEGPWLAQDPLAFTTTAPPSPASWLMDSFLYGVYSVGGFLGLRFVHIALVASTLAFAWSIVRRAAASARVASFATALLATLAAYRFVQLRPHLVSILAVYVLYRLLLEKREAPSWLRVALAVGLTWVWANSHPVYPIGPVLLVGACVALFFSNALARFASDPLDSAEAAEAKEGARLRRLAIAALACFAVSALHPMGFELYAKAFSVGSGAETLAVVVDEWAAFRPFVFPNLSLPPSRLSWVCIWVLLLLGGFAGLRSVWEWRKPVAARVPDVDPVLLPLAAAGLLAILAASRFTWLALFPMCLIVQVGKPWLAQRQPLAVMTIAIASLALVPAFLLAGAWPMVTRGLPTNLAGYAQPYAISKYHAHAVWFLADANLEGNLFGRYSEGGFQSFWLGPRVRTAMNGALNMSEASLAQSFAIRERIGTPAHPRFEDALDAMGVDLFLGTGVPMEERPGRPPNYSTLHLDGAAEWIRIFRNVDSAIYLRRNERNAENLARVEAYYAARGVPFDAARGFEPASAIRFAPGWALDSGLRTHATDAWLAGNAGPDEWRAAASTFLALGMPAVAEQVNVQILRGDPKNHAALERRLWLMLARPDAVGRRRLAETVAALAHSPGRNERTDALMQMGGQILLGKPLPPHRLARRVVFSRAEGRFVRAGIPAPEIRARRL